MLLPRLAASQDTNLDLTSPAARLYGYIMFANFWQFAISMTYLQVNGVISCFLVNREWAGYASERKALRVTAPEGIQRSTYFVSMPFRYGLPLLSIMAILHWTVSQSIFVLQISSYNDNGSPDIGNSYPINGFSCLPILVCECPQILARTAFPETNFDG